MASITLFGSTGLIGNEILKLLEKDDYFKNINVISCLLYTSDAADE